MSQIIVGHFEPDSSIIYLPVGFIPDWFRLVELGVTNPIFYEWWERMEDDEASGSQEGIKIIGGAADGSAAATKLADAGGITAYDSGSEGPAVYVWAASTTTLAKKFDATDTTTRAARTATAHGTYIMPSTGSTVDRDAILECVTASGNTGATEPDWNVGIGQQVTDGSNVWERVNVPLKRMGYQGVTIAAALMTNSQEMYYLALQADRSIDHGDVDGWTDGVEGA